MTDSANQEGNALDYALSEVMGEVEEPRGQPEAETTDEEETVTDTETEEAEGEAEAEDSDDEQPEADAEDEAETEEEEESEVDPEVYESEAFELDGEQITRKEIRELKDKEKNLQAGYTKKYQKLSETQKQADERYEKADQTLQFLENQLKGPLTQFEQVNWQELKMSDPAKYQQTLQQYQAAQQGFNQVEQARKQLQDNLAKEREATQAKKAQEAVETLKEMHSDWSNDLYHQVLEYAVESGVPKDEIASETRPWVISALLSQMRAQKAQKVETTRKPQSVKKTIKQKAAPKPRSNSQKRADQVKRDRALAKKGDRAAQTRLIHAEVDSQLGL